MKPLTTPTKPGFATPGSPRLSEPWGFCQPLRRMEGSDQPASTSGTLPAWVWPTLMIGALLFFGAGTWLLPLMDRDEPRFAEASREMLESGNWIVPHLNGQYRFDKPPLIYWLQAAGIAVLGPSEAAVRWPSVLCATLTLGLITTWGRRLAGDRTGLMAGILWATCPQAFVHAHLAVADMAMVFFFTLSAWSGWEWHRSGPGARGFSGWFWTFFTSLALGFLAKGPVAWLAALPAILMGWGLVGDRHAAPVPSRRPVLWLCGGLWTLALVAAWGIPALVATRGAFFEVGIGKHVVARSVGVLEGHGLKGLTGYLGSLPFYGLTLLVGFLPWSPWLVSLVWRRRGGPSLPPIDRYLAIGIAGVFVVFTLIRTKLPHYTLPAFPLIALWLGKALAIDPSAFRIFRRMAVTTALVLGLVAGPGLWLFGRMLPVPPLAEAVRSRIGPKTEIATLGFAEPSVYWYFRPTGGPWVRHLDDEAQALEFLGRSGSRLCILPEGESFGRLTARFPELQTLRADGFNPANGKRVGLRILLRESP